MLSRTSLLSDHPGFHASWICSACAEGTPVPLKRFQKGLFLLSRVLGSGKLPYPEANVSKESAESSSDFQKHLSPMEYDLTGYLI